MSETYEPGITVAEAAERLGIGVDAIHKRIKRGTLRAWKQGGEWRVVLPEKTLTIGPGSPTVPEVVESDVASISEQYSWLIRPYQERMEALNQQIGRLTAERDAARRDLLAAQRLLMKLARVQDGE